MEQMNFEIKVTNKSFENIPDGEYMAQVAGLELDVNIPDGKGGVFDSIKWKFNIGKQYYVVGKSSTNLSKMSKAYAWIQSITGIQLKEGDKFSPALVTGKPCRVMIKNKVVPKADGTMAMFPNVVNVVPA